MGRDERGVKSTDFYLEVIGLWEYGRRSAAEVNYN